MLVLSRKPGQEIRIDEQISVVVLGISGDRVKLGFRAPREVSVRRGELNVEDESQYQVAWATLGGR
jgi:carbon storage regulator